MMKASIKFAGIESNIEIENFIWNINNLNQNLHILINEPEIMSQFGFLKYLFSYSSKSLVQDLLLKVIQV